MSTINIPTKQGTMAVTGKVVLLYVGDRQERFFIHADSAGSPILSHYASGYRITELNAMKVLHHRSYARMTDRAAAKAYVDRLVAQHGVDRVRERLAAMPVLNGPNDRPRVYTTWAEWNDDYIALLKKRNKAERDRDNWKLTPKRRSNAAKRLVVCEHNIEAHLKLDRPPSGVMCNVCQPT